MAISSCVLCGFASSGSITILIGGIRGVAPGRGGEVVCLGIKAVTAGTRAAFITACLAGVLA